MEKYDSMHKITNKITAPMVGWHWLVQGFEDAARRIESFKR